MEMLFTLLLLFLLLFEEESNREGLGKAVAMTLWPFLGLLKENARAEQTVAKAANADLLIFMIVYLSCLYCTLLM